MSDGTPSDPKKEGLQSAAEVLKVTLALATGALVFGAGLVKEHLALQGDAKYLLVAAWALLAVSAAGGILAISAIPVMLGESKYDLEDPYLTWPARVHQIAFVIGIVCLGAALAIAFFTGETKAPADSGKAVQMLCTPTASR